MSRTSLVSTLSGIGTLLAVIACEGEPPKVPSNAMATAAPPSSEPAAAAETSAATPAMPGSAGPEHGGGCPCMGQGTGMGMGMSASSGAAPQASAGTAEPSPPGGAAAAPAAAAAAHGNIVGTVTTMPARSAGAAVVYLEDAPIVPGRGSSARVDNRQMSFVPFITVVAKGGRVLFTNEDPFPHNVFSADHERFNLGMINQKGAGSHVFDKAGVYSLLCNLHPNMLGYVVVAPSSFFARADAKGHFVMKDVPSGTYKITAWAPRQVPATQPVTVKDGDVTVSFDLHH